MKNLKKALVGTFLLMYSLSHAQFGDLLNKASKKSNNAESKSGLKSVSLDWSQYTQTAAITMKSLLEGTTVSKSGLLNTNRYIATFVPNKKTSGSPVQMIDDKNVLTTKIYFNDQFVKETPYPNGGYLMEGKQVSYTDVKNEANIQLDKEGKFRIDFFAGGVHFYSFEFNVYKKVNADPYATNNTIWYAGGPWEKYAFVTPETSGNFIWGFYLSHNEFKPDPNDPNKTTKSIEWSPELMKDGKVISVVDKRTEKIELGVWTKTKMAIKLIGGKDYLKISDLQDGVYTMKITVNGESSPRLYDFTMSGGKIVLSEKQDRAKYKDPKTLIEGWNDYFWMERK